jgi:hypothetical protein
VEAIASEPEDGWVDHPLLARLRELSLGGQLVLVKNGCELASQKDLRTFLTTQAGDQTPYEGGGRDLFLARSRSGATAQLLEERDLGPVSQGHLALEWREPPPRVQKKQPPATLPHTPAEVYASVRAIPMPQRIDTFLERATESSRAYPAAWPDAHNLLSAFWPLER